MARDKHKYHPAIWLITCLALSLAACLDLKQPRNKIEYYTLEYDPPVLQMHPPISDAIRVNQFSVSPIYDTHRIIYRDGLFKREAYVYYKWRTNPGDMVTYSLRRDMQHSGLFQAVVSRDSRLQPAFLLEGTVDEFLEWDNQNSWEALLSMSITFMQENETNLNKKILFQKTYHTTKPCRQKNPRALAEAMSLAMSEISKQIILDIYTFIQSSRPK